MTTNFLAQDIKAEEGERLVGYFDSAGVATCGVGHTGPDVHVGMTITHEQSQAWLAADILHAIKGLNASLPWWGGLDDVRQDVFVQMAFQMGVPGFLRFKDTLKAAQRADYARAADCMLNSDWAKQTPARARRMAMQMRSGVRAWARAIQSPPTMGTQEQNT